MTLVKIISGGQTGVDIAALRAAKTVGLRTGGWMPRGYRTLNGPKPIYADMFGFTNLRELVSDMPRVLTFLRERKVVVLNVAGNSEFTAPGIESKAEWYLTLLFRAMKFREENV